MAIVLNELTQNDVIANSLWQKGAALALVAAVVTVVVYGTVAIIVKLDDIGLAMTKSVSVAKQRFGEGLVAFVPKLLVALSFIGTIAMLWVGGGIIVHGTHEIGFDLLYDFVHGAEYAGKSVTGAFSGVLGWLTYAALSAILGLVLGFVIATFLHKVVKMGHGPGDAEAH